LHTTIGYERLAIDYFSRRPLAYKLEELFYDVLGVQCGMQFVFVIEYTVIATCILRYMDWCIVCYIKAYIKFTKSTKTSVNT
jgi:hypothetical protein